MTPAYPASPRWVGAFAALLVTAGCSSMVASAYRPAVGRPEAFPPPDTAAVQVFTSLDPAADGAKLERDGYVRIGLSAFRKSGRVKLEDLQAEARDIGAGIVLFAMANPRSHGAVQPLVEKNDGTATALTPYVHVTGAVTLFGNYGGTTGVGGGMMDFKGSVTSSGVPGVTSADAAFINAPEFDYSASFWRRRVR